MYVDKRLDGVQAVQTLSRLNRNDSGQGEPVRPRFRQRGREHLPSLQALLRHDELAGRLRPAAVGEAEARARPGAGLSLERGRGVRPRLLQAREPDRARSDHARHAAPPAASGGPLQGDRGRAKARGVPREAERLREDLRLPEPDRALRRSAIWRCSTATGASCCRTCRSTATPAIVKVGDEVGLQYYRLERVYSGAIDLREGEAGGREEPDGCRHRARPRTRRCRCPRSSRCSTSDSARSSPRRTGFFFEQIKEKAIANEQVIRLRRWPTRSTSSSSASAS